MSKRQFNMEVIVEEYKRIPFGNIWVRITYKVKNCNDLGFLKYQDVKDVVSWERYKYISENWPKFDGVDGKYQLNNDIPNEEILWAFKEKNEALFYEYYTFSKTHLKRARGKLYTAIIPIEYQPAQKT